MSNKDYQNGFIAGAVSGGVVEVIDTTEIDNLETLIDESGVLEDTEGTVSEKVEQLIDKANVKGIFFSEFNTYYAQPQVADLRTMPLPRSESAGQTFGNYLSHLFYNANTNGNGGQFVLLRDVYLPDGICIFASSIFYNCVKLSNIYGDLSKINTISSNAFCNCRSLSEFPYMPNLKSINSNSFNGCTGLTEIKLYNTLTTFSNNAFNGCTNITDIYVPWSEGEVANAPWGATNATIHYNYVEGEETNAES